MILNFACFNQVPRLKKDLDQVSSTTLAQRAIIRGPLGPNVQNMNPLYIPSRVIKPNWQIPKKEMRFECENSSIQWGPDSQVGL